MSAVTSFWFEPTPTPEEAKRQLDALEARRHAEHDRPAPFCTLCPPAPSRHRGCAS